MQVRLAERLSAGLFQRLQVIGATAARLALPCYLVGGAVRDALLGCEALDLDIVVEGKASKLASALGGELRVRVRAHEQFGTAALHLGVWNVDVVTARKETYPAPGALPVVESARLDDDLRRRDFSMNCLAVRLDEFSDELYDPLDGLNDLRNGLIRGLHAQTFRDDPTRIIRAARYAARFGYSLEPETAIWLLNAVQENALATVSGPRVWGELQRLLKESHFVAASRLLAQWGVLQKLQLTTASLSDLEELSAAEGFLRKPIEGCMLPGAMLSETAGERALAALGLLAGPAAADRAQYLGLSANETRTVTAAAIFGLAPPEALSRTETSNSVLHRLLIQQPLAALLVLWVAQPLARPQLLRFLDLRDVCADITGDDLKGAGFIPSAGFRPALQAALDAKLDRHTHPDEQLALAVQVLRNWQQEHGL